MAPYGDLRTIRFVPAIPTLDLELSLRASGVRLLGAADEVGRGAVAGVVSVGLVVIDLESVEPLEGVADSKLLSASQRERLAPSVKSWAAASAVGHATPDEVERDGIVTALRYAALRALDQVTVVPDLILLDGSHDWLTSPSQLSLFGAPAGDAPRVMTRVKADRDCLSVAAASVIAKVERDRIMHELDAQYPGYGFKENAGYGTPAHLQACRVIGLSPAHRKSWVKSR